MRSRLEWKRVLQCPFGDPASLSIEKRIAQDEKRIGSFSPELVKSFVYVRLGRSVHEANRQPQATSRLFCFIDLKLRIGILGVHQTAKGAGIWDQLMK
jgi:hypothetical protein